MPTGTTILLFCLSLSLFGLFQSFFLYPLELRFANEFLAENRNSAEGRPSVTLIIAAYNEEDVIEEKIRNSLELEYPDSKLDVVVFSDASDDRTDEIVRSFANQSIELMRIEGRVGKTACQNRVVETVESDIVLFSDANSMYDPDAISHLIDKFGPDVGCVVGELRYQDREVQGESFYWRYESMIKRLESRFNTLVTGNGAIYAVRRDSYIPLPRDSISDFAEPLEIVRNGETVKYAPDAVAYESTDGSVKAEFDRRVRIVTRSWNSIVEYTDLLNPLRRPRFAFQLWSHKVLRWLSPVLLAITFVATVGLAIWTDSYAFELLLIGQVLFYILALIGGIVEWSNRDGVFITHLPYYFMRSNYGMALGLWNFIRGNNIVVWETSSRDSSE